MVNTDKIHQDLHRYFEDANTEMPLNEDQYQIDDQGVVHVQADVLRIRGSVNGALPVQFGRVDGDFLVHDMSLTSLVGAPHIVLGAFNCSQNFLTSLMHAPRTCEYMDCSHNKLTNLSHAPIVSNSLDCSYNLITDLATCPPAQDVFASYNPFENFRNTSTNIERVTITYKPNLPLLGLLSVHHVEIFDPDTGEYKEDLSKILNAHAGKGVSNKAHMLKCATELIKAGYKENARW
jgi:hypothetical protein